MISLVLHSVHYSTLVNTKPFSSANHSNANQLLLCSSTFLVLLLTYTYQSIMSRQYDDTNPHFWPRDRFQPPPGRPRADDEDYPPAEPLLDQLPYPDRTQPTGKTKPKPKPRKDHRPQDHIYLPPGARPSLDQPQPLRPAPGRIRRRERPDHVHFPPAAPIAPTTQQQFPLPRDYDWPQLPPRLEPFPPAEPSYPSHQQPPYKPPTQSLHEPTPPVFAPPVDPSHPTNLDHPKPTRPSGGGYRKQHSKPTGSPPTTPFFPPRHSEDRYGHHPEDNRQGRRRQRFGAGGLYYPSPERTNPLTWCSAVFCVIFWIAVILAGLLVLIIYLVYRPQKPHFEISEASLNTAYMDIGAHINIDLTLLVNFTNMNRKMGVTIDFVTLRLYYENNLIANRYVTPFSAAKRESKVMVVEMVGSQVRLPVVTAQQLMRQLQSNRISFEVDGMFHARTSFGIYKYNYWMTRHCTFATTGPPSGVMVEQSSCSAIR